MNTWSNREYMLFGFSFFVLLLVILVIATIFKIIYEKQVILKNGIRTVAIIRSTEQSTGGKGGHLNINIGISFNTQNGETINTSRTSRIPILDIENYKPGKEVDIIYNQRDPKKFILSSK